MSEHDASALDVARQGLLRISDERILEVVDELDLRAHAKVTAVIGVPLRRLQQSRDVTAFAVGATQGIVIKVAGVTQRLLVPSGARLTLVSEKNVRSLLN